MPPKKASKKRAADSDWKTSDRVRAALVSVNTAVEQALRVLHSLPDASVPLAGDFRSQIVASSSALAQSVARVGTDYNLPPLPTDCWRIIMEFALGQRTCATFGPSGCVNEARDYYGNITQSGFASIHPMRLVSRAWNRIASQLVRSLYLDNGLSKKIRHPLSIADTFPNVTRIRYRALANADQYAVFVGKLRNTLKKQWEVQHPGSLRTIVTSAHTFGGFVGGAFESRVFTTRGNQDECHAFASNHPIKHTLCHAEAWCVCDAAVLDNLLDNTKKSGLTLGRRIPVVVRELFESETMCISDWESNYHDITAMIHLHIISHQEPVDLVMDYLIKCFASVTVHTSEKQIPAWAKYQPNVYADAHHYQKLWRIGAAVPVIG